MSFNPIKVLAEYRVKSSPLADLLKLSSSFLPDITTAIHQARADPKTKMVEVDLGDGHQWWHTRLFLLAALAEDYTNVRVVVFHADRGPLKRAYVGMVFPGATRLGLGAVTPVLQSAYAMAQVSQPGPLHSVDAVQGLASAFPLHLGVPEQTMKIDVNESLLKKWLGSSLLTASLPWEPAPGQPLPAQQLLPILERPEPFVALTSGGRLVQMVDKEQLGARLALDALNQPA